MSGDGLSREVQCQNCHKKLDFSAVSEKIKCPRCGCGVMLDLVIPQNGAPTVEARQYTESEIQSPIFKNPRLG